MIRRNLTSRDAWLIMSLHGGRNAVQVMSRMDFQMNTEVLMPESLYPAHNRLQSFPFLSIQKKLTSEDHHNGTI